MIVNNHIKTSKQIMIGVAIGLLLLIPTYIFSIQLYTLQTEITSDRNIELHTYGWKFDDGLTLSSMISENTPHLLALSISSDSYGKIFLHDSSTFYAFPHSETDEKIIFHDGTNFIEEKDRPIFDLNTTIRGYGDGYNELLSPDKLQPINNGLVDLIGTDDELIEREREDYYNILHGISSKVNIEHIFNDGVLIDLTISQDLVLVEFTFISRFTIDANALGWGYGVSETQPGPIMQRFYELDKDDFNIDVYIEGVNTVISTYLSE